MIDFSTQCNCSPNIDTSQYIVKSSKQVPIQTIMIHCHDGYAVLQDKLMMQRNRMMQLDNETNQKRCSYMLHSNISVYQIKKTHGTEPIKFGNQHATMLTITVPVTWISITMSTIYSNVTKNKRQPLK